MRKGSRCYDWTTEELKFLREHAGVVSVREICRHLRRSYRSVAMMAHRMRLSLRCPTSRLKWCTRCATYRLGLLEKTGQCRVCFKRDQLTRAKERTARAFEALSANDKALYAKNLISREDNPEPRPKAQEVSYKALSRYERVRAEERYAEALERWEIRHLDKLINKEKTLTKRMRQKTNTNPRK